MDLEQLEAFALGDDREAALAQLVPGTEDHDYHKALWLQQQGRFGEVDALLDEWAKRHGHGERRLRIERRQLLYRLGRFEEGAVEKVVSEFGVELNHQADLDSERQRHPSRLEAAAVDERALVERARARDSDLRAITDDGLPLLLGAALDGTRRRHLLTRLSASNDPRLVGLVAADLADKNSRGFGSVGVHGRLTTAQLEALAELRPELRGDEGWVGKMLARLRPPGHVDWQGDRAARAAYLDAAITFVATLPPTFNTLLAHLLWHRLDNDRHLGRYDRARFVEYLAVPRQASYVRSRWVEKLDPNHVAQIGINHSAATGLPPVLDEEGLVRDYLHRFLAEEDGAAFAGWLESSWLERELATARLLAGDPDVERWTTRLGAAAAAALRDRVDLDLARDNPARLGAGDSVAIAADVKNVPSLTLKVFRVDELAYFLAHGAEPTTAIDLDGLAGGFEETIRLDAPAMQRVRRRFELPACAGPGTYVVELIGNGKSSRALVRKGRLRYAARVGAAGLVVAVADEAGRPLGDAAIWTGGREYRAGDGGLIALPFSTRSGTVPVLLVGGGVAQREELELPRESYALTADISVEREALGAGGTARAILQARLTCAGMPAPIALLEEARVEIATTDGQGAASAREQRVELADDRDAVIEWAMPPNVVELRLTLRGKARVASEQRDDELSNGVTVNVAEIHRSARTEALFLAKTDAGWVVSVLGKTGEPRPRRQIKITLRHRAVTDELPFSLDTDERGRVELGPLEGVTQIAAETATSASQVWALTGPPVAPLQMHLLEGDRAALPLPWHLGGAEACARATIFERRGGSVARDASEYLRAEPGAIVAEGLPAGEYQLSAPGVGDVRLRVVPESTPVVAGWAALPAESIRLTPRQARLGACAVDSNGLRVEVLDAGPSTRVHVVATRLAPDPAGRPLEQPPRYLGARPDPAVECRYVSGRNLGDEYRYVLERRNSKRRPGILLERPGLLLNPWAVRSTSTDVASAVEGGEYLSAGARAPAAPAPSRSTRGGGGGRQQQHPDFASYDWAPRPVAIAANLRPDASGAITLDRAAFEGMGALTIYCVDPGATSSRRLALAEAAEPPKDLRLRPGLDPERHAIERKDVLGLPAGETLTVDDLATARVEIVDTLGKAYRYLLALGDDPTLREFGFVARWHELSPAEKRAKYSKYACHELHLFLYWKDRAFFDEVVKPYLANKRPLTFVDRWLLDEDLSRDVELWRFGRLNTFERCLLLRRASAGVADATRRLIGDEVELSPPDPEGDARLVDALLGTSALSNEQGEVGNALARAQELALADMSTLLEEVADEAETTVDRFSAVRSRAYPDESPKLAKKKEAPRSAGPMAAGGGAMAAPPPQVRRSMSAADRMAGDEPVADDLRRRDEIAPLYRGADLTREWAENNWWHHRPGSPPIAANRFWRDFAEHREGPFLSPHLGLCVGSFHEAMCALAALDLPFVAGEHEVRVAEGRMTLRAASNTLVARRQLADVAPVAEASAVLIGQNLVRADDRHGWDGNERREKYVTGELLAGVVYTQLVAVTNPTSTPTRVDVLVQIPRGSLPVASNTPTRTVHLQLDAYGTGTHEQSFYFPAPGRFGHYPAHVARKGELLAWAPPSICDVVLEPTTVDPTSWRYLSQRGSLEQVATFLATANLGRVDLSSVAFRMKDRAWFERVTGTLVARGHYDPALWGYALLHRDGARLREWLEHQDDWLRAAGPFAPGPVPGDEEERGWHEHLEYAPLVNARAHRLGAKARILNEGLAGQYREALDWVAQRPLTGRDRARAAHYLFTQDRLDEALALEARLEPGPGGPRLQLDYLRAYAACARGDLAAARAIAMPRVGHPVDRWSRRFSALVAMLDEAEGRVGAAIDDPDDRDRRIEGLAARQPAFEIAADPGGVTVDYRNLDALELRFHRMDLELLFSRQPFMQGDAARFSFVEPGVRLRLELGGEGRARVAWPDGLARSSVVVEASAAGARKAVAHYAHDLLVTVAHQYGQLRVARASKRAALPAAYVKVYGRQHGGGVAFYKDGYTDLSGRFDYATLSTADLDRVERFAILVASDEAGALVVEAAPPAQ